MSDSKLFYHYTSVDSFFKIISEQNLRLTDIQFFSDAEDGIHFYNYFKNVYIANFEKEKQKLLNECYRAATRPLEQMFACCFSTLPDSLTQWQIYGDRGAGVALGFKKDLFKCAEKSETNIFQKHWAADKVDYDDDNIKPSIDAAVDKLLKEVDKNPSNKKKAIQEAQIKIRRLAPFHKNKIYDHENEYRLVFMPDPQDGSSSSRIIAEEKEFFYLKKNRIVNFIKKDITWKGHPLNDNNCFLGEIVLGPYCSLKVENDIRNFVSSYQIAPSYIKIISSKIKVQ